MYGALLVRDTEHVRKGTADIGVLFLHNEGYSTSESPLFAVREASAIDVAYCSVCGHATLALGRFFVDTHDSTIFPRRQMLRYDDATQTTTLRLHAPCGVVTVSVPTRKLQGDDGEERLVSDSEKPVSFTSVPCYAPLITHSLPIPPENQWPRLRASGKSSVRISIAYGGAFYCLVDAKELGFTEGLRTRGVGLEDYDLATRRIKALIEDDGDFCKQYLRHPDEDDLSYLCTSLCRFRCRGVCHILSICTQSTQIRSWWSIIMMSRHVPTHLHLRRQVSASLPTSTFITLPISQHGITDSVVCRQIDRSPTGSCACARIALRLAEGTLCMHEPRDFHSLVSLASDQTGDAVDRGAFRASGIAETALSDGTPAVVVRLEGKAWYTGMSVFVAEELDGIARDGFQLRLPNGWTEG